jgi:GntR family transcriptional regulator, transcriptional repressor for pyruvate dehydrogenase complex
MSSTSLSCSPVLRVAERDSQRIGRLLSDKLEAEIRSGTLKPGARLPTEAALGRRFNASRSPVREALQILKARGLIVTRQGSGSFVAIDSSKSFGQSMERYASLLADAPSFLELLDLRLLLESFCVRKMALQRPAGPMAAMQKHLRNMESHLDDLTRFGQEDMYFHLAIARGADHTLFQSILESMLPTLGLRFAAQTYTNHDLARKNLRDHKQIARAIELGDVSKADAAMQKHLRESQEHLQSMLKKQL